MHINNSLMHIIANFPHIFQTLVFHHPFNSQWETGVVNAIYCCLYLLFIFSADFSMQTDKMKALLAALIQCESTKCLLVMCEQENDRPL